jgi:hypothetical protein
MEKKMNKFFTKASALVFACLSTSLVFGAGPHAGAIVSDVQLGIEDVLHPTTATSAIPSDLPIHKCVLDFSDTIPVLISAAKLGGYLISENSTGKLDLIDIAYLTMEGVAAGARKDPGKFGEFAPYVANQDAIFNAFARSIGRIRTAQHDLSVLGNPETCEEFVRDTLTLDLPAVLDELLAATTVSVLVENKAKITSGIVSIIAADTGLPVVLDELLAATTASVLVENKAKIKSGIVSIIEADPAGFIPMFAKLLNTSYNGLANAAAVVTADLEAIKEKISGCGCFPCFSGKKKR